MYERIKWLIPSVFIKKNERFLRRFISLFYMGNKYQCNICDFKMSSFVVLKNRDKLCPNCGSRSRTRRLWSLLEDKIDGQKILHFSPSKSIKQKIESIKSIDYTSTDYAGEFQASKKLNIEAIEESDNSYDLVICYHILEHIPNDLQAMKELYRILIPNGICFIQTPFKSGDIYENESIKTEEERLQHFGQKDHLRIYSVKGLMDRLESVGFDLQLLKYEEIEGNKYGFNPNENIIKARKANKS